MAWSRQSPEIAPGEALCEKGALEDRAEVGPGLLAIDMAAWKAHLLLEHGFDPGLHPGSHIKWWAEMKCWVSNNQNAAGNPFCSQGAALPSSLPGTGSWGRGAVLYPALTLGMKKMVRFLKGLETSPSGWDQMPENREDSCRGCRPHSRQRHCPSLSVASVQLVRRFQQIVSDTRAEFWP